MEFKNTMQKMDFYSYIYVYAYIFIYCNTIDSSRNLETTKMSQRDEWIKGIPTHLNIMQLSGKINPQSLFTTERYGEYSAELNDSKGDRHKMIKYTCFIYVHI